MEPVPLSRVVEVAVLVPYPLAIQAAEVGGVGLDGPIGGGGRGVGEKGVEGGPWREVLERVELGTVSGVGGWVRGRWVGGWGGGRDVR